MSGHSGSAEAIPLPDASVDAVVVGTAWYWFDTQPALAEIARVLRPGGVLAAMWNGDDASVEWVAGYHERAARGRVRAADADRRAACDEAGLSRLVLQGLIRHLVTIGDRGRCAPLIRTDVKEGADPRF